MGVIKGDTRSLDYSSYRGCIYRNNGKEHGNCYIIIGHILRLH